MSSSRRQSMPTSGKNASTGSVGSASGHLSNCTNNDAGPSTHTVANEQLLVPSKYLLKTPIEDTKDLLFGNYVLKILQYNGCTYLSDMMTPILRDLEKALYAKNVNSSLTLDDASQLSVLEKHLTKNLNYFKSHKM